MFLIAFASLIAVGLHSVHGQTVCNGHAVKVIDIDNGRLAVNSKDLNSILSRVPDNTPIGVIAIAGKYREGKSFVMNFFLQYLEFLSANPNEPRPVTKEWMHDVDMLCRFKFVNGMERHTVGIVMWSQPFTIKNKKGDTLSVLVMDSQGLFDLNTDSNDNVRLFTSVSLMSSSFIWNLKSVIDNQQLSDLKTFVDYAESKSSRRESFRTFQQLSFLMRDMSLMNPGEAGQKIMQMLASPSAHNETRSLVQRIHQGFSQLKAFALPPPGKYVTSGDFDGNLSKIEPEFVNYVKAFVQNITDEVQPRIPFSTPLNKTQFAAYTDDMVNFFNQQLPPSEYVKEQERQFLIRVTSQLNQMKMEHNKRFDDYCRELSDDQIMGRDTSILLADMKRIHEALKTEQITSLLDPKFILYHRGVAAVTAEDQLTEESDLQFQMKKFKVESCINDRYDTTVKDERMRERFEIFEAKEVVSKARKSFLFHLYRSIERMSSGMKMETHPINETMIREKCRSLVTSHFAEAITKYTQFCFANDPIQVRGSTVMTAKEILATSLNVSCTYEEDKCKDSVTTILKQERMDKAARLKRHFEHSTILETSRNKVIQKTLETVSQLPRSDSYFVKSGTNIEVSDFFRRIIAPQVDQVIREVTDHFSGNPFAKSVIEYHPVLGAKKTALDAFREKTQSWGEDAIKAAANKVIMNEYGRDLANARTTTTTTARPVIDARDMKSMLDHLVDLGVRSRPNPPSRSGPTVCLLIVCFNV